MAINQTRDGVETRALLPEGQEFNPSGIFGLRYLEDEAVEIHDVIGCLRMIGTCTACDDED